MGSLIYPAEMSEYLNDLFDKTIVDKEMIIRKDQNKTFSFKLKSLTDQITKTVQKFDDLLDTLKCCTSRDKSELATALSEALAKAIIHGNKTKEDKSVNLQIQLFRDKIEIIVEDEGQGFELPKALLRSLRVSYRLRIPCMLPFVRGFLCRLSRKVRAKPYRKPGVFPSRIGTPITAILQGDRWLSQA